MHGKIYRGIKPKWFIGRSSTDPHAGELRTGAGEWRREGDLGLLFVQLLCLNMY